MQHAKCEHVIMSKCQLKFPPEDKIAEGTEHLREKNTGILEMPDVQHDALKNFLLYFDKTYVSGAFCRVNGNEGAVRLRRLPLQFPPSV